MNDEYFVGSYTGWSSAVGDYMDSTIRLLDTYSTCIISIVSIDSLLGLKFPEVSL